MLPSFFSIFISFAGFGSLGSASPLPKIVSRDVSFADAEAAFNTLQQWYDEGSGLWIPSTGWWNSANCLTVVADLASIDSNVVSEAEDVFSTTYTNAQQYNEQSYKVMGSSAQPYLPQTYSADYQSLPHQSHQSRGSAARSTSGFLDDYYDDEGWWALAWIAAYDVSGVQDYLSQAQSIFDDMNAVFGQTNCSTNSGGTGGIWWDKSHSYVNAIANELFLSVAAQLANRPSLGSTTDYLSIAEQQWAWFQGSGMINSGDTINDGLDQQTCQNNDGTVWSYNQGVILGGLAGLSQATGDSSYITEAQGIADAAIAALAPDGILHDPCEPDCGADGTQFKGIFMRNLKILQAASPQTRYSDFLQNNANSIWANDRDSDNELSVDWAGPFVSPANASTQSSAMDALVASLAVS